VASDHRTTEKSPDCQGEKKLKKTGQKIDPGSSMPEITRVDDYAQHLINTRSLLPDSVRYFPHSADIQTNLIVLKLDI
jgi:hypothetical protein